MEVIQNNEFLKKPPSKLNLKKSTEQLRIREELKAQRKDDELFEKFIKFTKKIINKLSSTSTQ